MTLVRLSKLMGEKGICSRREADVFIERGLVLVDGKVVSELGTKVHPNAKITLKTGAKSLQDKKLTVLLNKPLGIVSCQPEKNYKEALSLIRNENRDPKFKTQQKLPPKLIKFAVAGRLDINSKGLLVLTQDGRIAKQLISQDGEIEKEYLVRIEGEVTPSKINHLQFGLSLDGKPLKPATVEELDTHFLRFVLKEGRKRQIRRMCEEVDLKVSSIKRVRIGNVKLGSLKLGQWRFLEDHEAF